MLSQRIRKFHGLIRQYYDQPEGWLVQVARNRQSSLLARMACLRVLVGRTNAGQPGFGFPYPQRKRLTRQILGV